MLLKSIRRMHGSRFGEQRRWTRHILLAVWIWVLVSRPVAGYFLGDTKAVLKDCVHHWTLQNSAAFPVLDKMTVCVDIRLMAPGPWVAFSYFSVPVRRPDLGLEGDENTMYFWLLKQKHRVPFHLSPNIWHRICLRGNVQEQSFSLEIDGEMGARRWVISQTVPPSGSLWLGCHPTDPLPGTTVGEVELYLFRIWDDLHQPELCEDGTVIGWRSEFWGVTSPDAREIDTNLKCDFRRLRHRVRHYRSINGNTFQGEGAAPGKATRNTATGKTSEPPTFSISTIDRTDHISPDPQSGSTPENGIPPTTISRHISNNTNDGAFTNTTVTPFKPNHHTMASRTLKPPLVSATANDSTDHILPNHQSTPLPTNVTPPTAETETETPRLTTLSRHTEFSTKDGTLANTTMMSFTSAHGTTSNSQTGPTPINGTLPTIVTPPPTVRQRTNFSKNDGTLANTIVTPVTSNNTSEPPMVTPSSSYSTDYIPLKNTTVQPSTIVSQHTAYSRNDGTILNTTVPPFTPTRDIPSNLRIDPTPTNGTPPTTVSQRTTFTRSDQTLANTTMMPFPSTHNTTSNSTSAPPMMSPSANYSTEYIPASTQSNPTPTNETSHTTASQRIIHNTNDGILGNTTMLLTSTSNTTSNSTLEPPMVSPSATHSPNQIPLNPQSRPTPINGTPATTVTPPTTVSQRIVHSTNDGTLANTTMTPFMSTHSTISNSTSVPSMVSPSASNNRDQILINTQSSPTPINGTPPTKVTLSTTVSRGIVDSTNVGTLANITVMLLTSTRDTTSNPQTNPTPTNGTPPTTVSRRTTFTRNDRTLANTTMMPFTSAHGTTSNSQTGPTPINGTLPTIVTPPPTVRQRTNFSKNDGTLANTILTPVMSTHDSTSNNTSEPPMVTPSSSYSTDYIPLKNTTVQPSTIVSQHTAFSRNDGTLLNTTVPPFTPTRDIPSNLRTDPTPTNETPPTTVSQRTTFTRNDQILANTTMMPFPSTHNTTSNSTSEPPMMSPSANYSTEYIPASTQSNPTPTNETSHTTASQRIIHNTNDGILGNTTMVLTSTSNTTSNSTLEPPMVSPSATHSPNQIPLNPQSRPTPINGTPATTVSRRIVHSTNDGTLANTTMTPFMSTHSTISNSTSVPSMVSPSASNNRDQILINTQSSPTPISGTPPTKVTLSTTVSRGIVDSTNVGTLANTTVMLSTSTRDTTSNPQTDPTPRNGSPLTTVSRRTVFSTNDGTSANTTMTPSTSTRGATAKSTLGPAMVSLSATHTTNRIPLNSQSSPTPTNGTPPTTVSQHVVSSTNDETLANATVTPFTTASAPLANSYTPAVSPINGEHASTTDATSRTASSTPPTKANPGSLFTTSSQTSAMRTTTPSLTGGWPHSCSCRAFCNSARKKKSRFFAVKIKIASSDFNKAYLQTLLSQHNVKALCETKRMPLCQNYNEYLKAHHLECQKTPQRCVVVLEMSQPVDVCSFANLIQEHIDRAGNIKRESSLSPLVVCGNPTSSVQNLLTSNLTWVDKILLLSDVCNSDESEFKCEASKTLAVDLTNTCSKPATTTPVAPQSSTLANNNPTTTAEVTTPSATNTTQQTNTTLQGGATAGLPLIGLNNTSTAQPALHTSSGNITVTASTRDNTTQVGLTPINSTRLSNTSAEHLTLQSTTTTQTNSTPNTPTSPTNTTVYIATVTISNNSTITTNATVSAITLLPNSTTVTNVPTTGMTPQTTTSNPMLSTSPQNTTPYTVTTTTSERHNSSITAHNTTFNTFTPSLNVTNAYNITGVTQQSVRNTTIITSTSLPNNVTTASTFTLFPNSTTKHNITTATQPLQSNTTLSTIAPLNDNRTLNSITVTSKLHNNTTTSNTAASTFTLFPNDTTTHNITTATQPLQSNTTLSTITPLPENRTLNNITVTSKPHNSTNTSNTTASTFTLFPTDTTHNITTATQPLQSNTTLSTITPLPENRTLNNVTVTSKPHNNTTTSNTTASTFTLFPNDTTHNITTATQPLQTNTTLSTITPLPDNRTLNNVTVTSKPHNNTNTSNTTASTFTLFPNDTTTHNITTVTQPLQSNTTLSTIAPLPDNRTLNNVTVTSKPHNNTTTSDTTASTFPLFPNDTTHNITTATQPLQSNTTLSTIAPLPDNRTLNNVTVTSKPHNSTNTSNTTASTFTLFPNDTTHNITTATQPLQSNTTLSTITPLPENRTLNNVTVTSKPHNSTNTSNTTASTFTLFPNDTTHSITTATQPLQSNTTLSTITPLPDNRTLNNITVTSKPHNNTTTSDTTASTFPLFPNDTTTHNITTATQPLQSNTTLSTITPLPDNRTLNNITVTSKPHNNTNTSNTTASTFTLFPNDTMPHNITTVTHPLQSNTFSAFTPLADNRTLNNITTVTSTSNLQNITSSSNTTISTFTTSPNNTTEDITSTTVYPNITESVNISSTVTSETQQITISSNITTMPTTATQVNKTFSNMTASPDNSTVDNITSVTLVPVINHTTQDTTVSVTIITAINNNDSSSSTPATSMKPSISLSTAVPSTNNNINQISKGPDFASTIAAAEDTSSGQTPATTNTTATIHGLYPPQNNPATGESALITTTPQKTTSTSQTTTTETPNSQTELEAQLDEFLRLTEDPSRLTSSQIEQLVGQLEKLLETPPVSQEVGQKIIDIVNNLLKADRAVLASSSNRLIRLVDDLGMKLAVTGSRVRRDSGGGPVVLSSESLVLAVKPVDATNFPTTSVKIFNVDDVEIKSLTRLQRRSARSPLASAVLPSSLIDGLSPEEQLQASTVQFTFYNNNILFMDEKLNNQTLVSSVLSCTVANLSIQNVTKNIHFTIQNANPENLDASCVFWDFSLNGGQGGWSSDGCFVLNTTMNDTTCSCNHLTAFAILLDLSRGGITDRTQALILTFITYIGCGISAIFLSFTLLTYLCFRKLLQDIPSKILVQLCLSLLFLNLVFLLDGWLVLYPATGLCISTAFFLHYFLLTSFTWVGLEAVHMYLSIVRVFTNYLNRYMLKFSLVGWGVPLIVVIIVIAVDKDNYGLVTYGRFRDGTSEDFCWLRNDIAFYVGLVAYFLAIFALCLVIFIIVLVQLNRVKKQNPHNQSPHRGVMADLRSICGLVILLGLTWGFALFAWGPLYLPFVYLFTIFNSLQGFFIFVFHCAVKKSVRRQWRTHLCCGKLWLPENSDWSRTGTRNRTNRAIVSPPTSAPDITSRTSSFTSNGTNGSGSVSADSGISEGSNSDVVLNELHRRDMPPRGET